MYKYIIIILGLLFFSGSIVASTLAEQRRIFKQTEKILDKANEDQFWKKVGQLGDYPLASYLKYQWLKHNLDEKARITRFLRKHARTRYARPLRKRWLNYLGQHKRWQDYLRFYQSGLGVAFTCQYNWALYQTGKPLKAMRAAQSLWVVGHSQPKQCDPLFNKFVHSPYLKQKMVWQRFVLAMNKGKTGLAAYVTKMLDPAKQKKANLWLQIHDDPGKVKTADKWKSKGTIEGLIFMHGIKRLINTDIETAIAVWDSKKTKFRIDKAHRQAMERRLAMQLTFNKDNRAYSRMSKLSHASKSVREWHVRSALLTDNWQNVQKALNKLSRSEKAREKWRYWSARTLYATGKEAKAKRLFVKLAKERSYYGFLAADHLEQDYQLSDRPVEVDQQALEKLMARRDFQAVWEFRFFNKEMEARRQWWFAIRNLKKAQLLAAAKLAQQWQWDQIAIFTIARAEYWDDVGLRFPLSYQQQVINNATQQQLQPAIVFGLVRRESAFYKDAQSPVGASGLMQIMPQTGRQIAAKLKEKWRSRQDLFDPNMNLKYGTYYYKQLLDRFEGNFVLAAAAYNAGPTRVDRWLPKDTLMSADIWIETIPYKETREYVSAILAYAMIYQRRIGSENTQKISDFMPDVKPVNEMNIMGNKKKLHF